MKVGYSHFRWGIILTVVLTLAACSNLSNPIEPVPEEPQQPLQPEEPEEPEEPEPIVPGLPVVKVMTDDGKMPTCEFVSAPEGCLGQSITNVTKVGGRMTITQNGKMLFDS